MKAQLILENGVRFNGKAFGYVKETVGEVVFNTGMTGYEELLTDPSYAGQIVTMTYPLIGNYGINLDDMESERPRLKGFVVREKCDFPNNWRCEMDLDGFLKQNKVMGIEAIDTRALTKILRDNGTMKGIITTRMDLSDKQIEMKFNSLNNKNVIRECTIEEKYVIEGKGTHIAFIDMGAKRGILRDFKARGCKLTVFPAFTSAEEILACNPDAVFLSNGPGDPKDVPEIIETVKQIVGKKPLLGVCMGNQLINLALGGDTKKMKFGHHGGNHPVKDLKTGRVYITSQNHEYVVCNLPEGVEAAFVNINDDTIEGIRHKTLPIFSVQFHPEASPGPLDSGFLFDRFLEIVERGGDNA
ncbi:MAG: carbamoyl phosphate synthase small subunit [Anaerotignaceae bacterium]